MFHFSSLVLFCRNPTPPPVYPSHPLHPPNPRPSTTTTTHSLQIADLEHRLSGAAVGTMVRTLKAQLSDKDAKMGALNEAIRKLKADLVALAQDAHERKATVA